MKTTYLSHFLSNDTPSYGNHDKVTITPKSEILSGETANTSCIKITNNHIGTHVDVPKHFYDNGRTYSDIPPNSWLFEKVCLIDIPCPTAKLISVDDFANHTIDSEVDFIIVRTGFETKRGEESYWSAYPGIDPDLCQTLRNRYTSLRAIGFDFISLTSPLFKDHGKKAHKVLLEELNGRYVYIVEDMKIAHIRANSDFKWLVMLPLLVKEGNGGPVTIIAQLT